MNVSPRLDTLRRPPVFVALALAAAFGAGAWWLADELTSHVRPASADSASSAPSAPPVFDAARQALDTTMEAAVPAAAAGTGAEVVAAGDSHAVVDPGVAGPAPALGDPYALLEPVDPAEALFGDAPAVRFSND